MTNRNFIPFPKLQTERLVLRQLTFKDEDEILKLRADNKVNKYLNRQPCKSIEDARVFIETINNNIKNHQSVYWAITQNGNDRLIGTICLYDFTSDNTKAEIGYELLPEFQGKGFMREALFMVLEYGFQTIGLTAIAAYTHPKNPRSTRLLESFNFKEKSKVSENLIELELHANLFASVL